MQEKQAYEEQSEKPMLLWKKGRNQNTIPQEKLRLIKMYCKHATKYWPGNKKKFWLMIWDVLWNITGYDFADPRNNIIR